MALDKLTTIQTSGIVATGIVTSNSFAGDGSGLTGVVGSGSGVVVQDDTSVVGTAGTIDFGTALDVSAISSGIVTVTASGGSGSIAGIDTTATSIFSTLDIGADIDVDGHTELDNINIAGVTTFAGNIDANADIDIDGHTNLDNVSIAGVTTFSEDVKFTGATSGRDVTFDKSDDSLGFADNAKLKIGESVVVFGAGGIGLNIIQGAKLHSAWPIIAVDIFDNRLKLASKLGATHTINSNYSESEKIISEITSQGGLDVFIDNTGIPKIIELGYKLVSSNGRVILVGVPKKGNNINIFSLPLHFGKTIVGSHGGEVNPNKDILRYLKLHDQKLINFKSLITEKYDLNKINVAISKMKNGESAGRIIIEL